MTKLLRITTFAVVLVALLVPVAGFAQTSRTTGALTGVVSDTSGTPLPGVTITITSPQLQGSRTTVSEANGEYLFATLPPGTYRAEYSLAGVGTAVREKVLVNLTQTTKVNVPLRIAVSETLTVTASTIVIDPTQTTQQQNFSQDHLKFGVVGSANRSYQSVLQQAAGVAGGSNPQVAGANNAQNNYMLDGITTTDPVTHTFSNNMAFDAIQEISIQTLGKSAEYGASGGTINVITKSGGNNLSGTADWRYRDTRTQGAGKATHPTGIAYYGATPTGSAINYNKNLRPSKNSTPQATVGGPVMRDRLWFFAAASRTDTAITSPNVYGFQPGTRTFKGWNNLAKVTFTPVANQTLTALFITNWAVIPFAQSSASSSTSPEADRVQTQGGRTYGLTYDTIISSKWLATAQLGHTPEYLTSGPMSGSLTIPARYDAGTGILRDNYTNFQARRSTRDELLATTTYFLEAFGTHAFKGGWDHNKTSFNSVNQATGDPSLIPGMPSDFCSSTYNWPAGTKCAGYLTLNQGVPYYVAVSAVNPRSSVAAKQDAFFAQDEWNPVTRATIRAGVRWERVNFSAAGKSIPSFKQVQPRLGVAYDVFNNATSVVHAFAGRIMDDNQLTLPNFGVSQLQGTDYFFWNAATSKYVYSAANSSLSLSGGGYDPNLKPSYSNQFSAGFTQKIWRNTSLDITGNYRKQHDLFEDYCGNDTAGFFDQCTLTNNPGADMGVHNALRSDYRAIIAKIESRPYNWLDMTASLTHGKSRGSTESTQNQDASFDFYPAHFTNTYGYLSDDAANRVKIDGYVRMPLEFTLGLNFYWDSGTPYSVYQSASTTSATGIYLPYGNYYIEPRGSRRLPSYSQTDLELRKDFRLAGAKVGLIASVYNVLNSETVTSIIGNAGSRAIADPTTGKLFIGTGTVTSGGNQVPYQQAGVNRIASNWGQPNAWQTPRRYEVGIRFEF
jgi:hypothetical protein